MATPAIARLRDIKTLPQLVAYLRDELDWPITSNNTEDITFDYEPSELGLDKETAVKIKEIKQLRPLTGSQPWGIFFVNFEKKRLPVMVMRRILRSLVFKKRTALRKSDRQAWHPSDLLFISAYGEEDDRAITFAHFVEDEELGGLAELRVLGWDDDDTPLHYGYVVEQLRAKLRWRDDYERRPDEWRTTWRSAFELRYREVVTSSQQLASRLAELAKKIRARVRTVLRYEDGFGQMRKLHAAFRKALIHDLTDDDFADMYAQTVTYGLFSAAVSRPAGIHGQNIVDMVPPTNPFLKEMLETFLKLGGRKGKIDFDELGIQEVVALLNNTNLAAVLRNFGNLTRREDPVIHFYEDFLREYDAAKRIKRGVFYTPQPVVSYIVRSIHELLQGEFKLAHGLADTITWGEMVRKTPGLKLPSISGDPESYQPIDESVPFVQILDPAVGTATFLVEVIDVIYRHLKTKWDQGGFKEMPQLPATSFPRQPADFSEYWNQYVAFSLLPRLYGFELMMAPYAIAHMKIGLKLWETGYRFAAEERAHIYLTNSLEPPSDIQRDLPALSPALAHEAQAVNQVKRNKRFTIVIGNPPYAGHSVNPSRDSDNRLTFIGRLIEDYKEGCPELFKPAQAKWLQDDYVKFIRLSEHLLRQSQFRLFGFITNHSYLNNPTFRGMRRHLQQSFDTISVLDLHGNIKRVEVSNGEKDENVFDIQQGVAIQVSYSSRLGNTPECVRHADLWGNRSSKYDTLARRAVSSTIWNTISASEPLFLFVPRDESLLPEYERGWRISDIMSLGGDPAPGVVSTHDEFAFAFTEREMAANIESFLATKNENEARQLFRLCTQSQWNYHTAKRELPKTDWRKKFLAILYRPFDLRFTINDSNVAVHRRERVLRHMTGLTNLAMCTDRQVNGRFQHVFCTRNMANDCALSTASKERTYILPLFLLPDGMSLKIHDNQRPNLSAEFLRALSETLQLPPVGELGLAERITPEEIFTYAYAVLHSPTYRSRYAEFLKIDFPRLPLTGNLELFRALAKLGGELVALHLLESPKLDKPHTEFIGSNRTVEKINHSKNTVWIDKAQAVGFRGVPEDVWNFPIGGYQVCEKWLKDRKGRTLSKDDIAHYHKIVIALAETIRLMSEIDKIILKHGGWPAAFATATAQKE